MADVSNIHRLHNQRRRTPPQSRRTVPAAATYDSLEEGEMEGEEDFYHQSNPVFFDFDSLSSPFHPSSPSALDDYTAPFTFGFDISSEGDDLDSDDGEDPNCLFYGSEEDAEQMNFVTDLFESRESHLTQDPIWNTDSERLADSGLEFGFEPGLGESSGLRVVGMDSESDSENIVVSSAFVINDYENYDGFEVNNDNYISGNEREEFEWEEVNERNHFDETENLNSVIDRFEEVTVGSDISTSERESSILADDEEERSIAWEVLLAMNNLDRNLELDNLEESLESEIRRGSLPEDYILAMEYDALFGQLVDSENALKGSPPAAKSVVENLPSVLLTKDEVKGNNGTVSCAVCMDEIPVGEKLTRMPCSHLYHGECILPWLQCRNTCPVCRYELPTDDADYEKWKCGRRSGGLAHMADNVR